ncbi:hypothetical protein FACS189441_7290 [Betaproteobacteria bacterium]|nr:hypothetical protein FACS189441_7290 [Betaproteobacteria bacterium]
MNSERTEKKSSIAEQEKTGGNRRVGRKAGEPAFDMERRAVYRLAFEGVSLAQTLETIIADVECRFAGLQVCRFAGLQVCRFAGLQVCRFAQYIIFML